MNILSLSTCARITAAPYVQFVMGTGLIPADGEVWKVRRKTVVPALHRKYVESMIDMFGECGLNASAQLARSEEAGTTVEMENFYSRAVRRCRLNTSG